MSLLKLEPNNNAAKKECDVIKEAYRKVKDRLISDTVTALDGYTYASPL